jgi:hypothetical protein
MSRTKSTSPKTKALDERIAIRKWLARHGPWHSSLPSGITQPTLDAELARLAKEGVLSLFSWTADGIGYELPALPEGQLACSRVYKAGPHWDSYVSGW